MGNTVKKDEEDLKSTIIFDVTALNKEEESLTQEIPLSDQAFTLNEASAPTPSNDLIEEIDVATLIRQEVTAAKGFEAVGVEAVEEEKGETKAETLTESAASDGVAFDLPADMDLELEGGGSVVEDREKEEDLQESEVLDDTPEDIGPISFGEEAKEATLYTEEKETLSEIEQTTEDFVSSEESEKEGAQFYQDQLTHHQALIREIREERDKLLGQLKAYEEKLVIRERESLTARSEKEELAIEMNLLKKRHSDEEDALRYRIKMSDERRMIFEEKYKNLQKEMEHVFHLSRLDIGKIKQRENELESQLDLLKTDVQMQIASRDSKILELKKKIDMLQFEIDSRRLKDQDVKTQSVVLEEKIHNVMKTLRMTLGMLEDDSSVNSRQKKDAGFKI